MILRSCLVFTALRTQGRAIQPIDEIRTAPARRRFSENVFTSDVPAVEFRKDLWGIENILRAVRRLDQNPVHMLGNRYCISRGVRINNKESHFHKPCAFTQPPTLKNEARVVRASSS